MALVFQYGSNCATAEINSARRLQGDAKFFSIARTVEDYELAFQVYSKNRRCAASNIVEKQGEAVWGVVWEIPEYLLSRATAGKRPSLDAIEGEGSNYVRATIRVRLYSDEILTVMTYVAKDPKAGLETNLDYVTLIVVGLREHNVPKTYIDHVKAIACENNNSIATEILAL